MRRMKLPRILAATLALLAISALCAFGGPPLVSEKEIPNFATVTPGIYRGAAPTGAGLKRLKEMGVRTVIDLRIERRGQKEEAQETQALGFERLRIPLGREAPTKKQVA